MNTAPFFKDIAFTVLVVADVLRARLFYEGILGLAVTANWDNKWVEYDVGPGTLAITLADEKHTPGGHGAMVGLEVNDLDQVIGHIKSKSVPIIEGPFDSPACRGCVIRDPDGNELILHAKK